ncbi:MAG: BON domain-containing protein [Pirellulaceae bacterium]
MKTAVDAQATAAPTDLDLARRVHLFLTANRRGFHDVNVRAQSGTVRLSGPVSSFFLRQMAFMLAKKVVGVHLVIDDLDVDPLETAPSRTKESTPGDAQGVDEYIPTDWQ